MRMIAICYFIYLIKDFYIKNNKPIWNYKRVLLVSFIVQIISLIIFLFVDAFGIWYSLGYLLEENDFMFYSLNLLKIFSGLLFILSLNASIYSYYRLIKMHRFRTIINIPYEE